MRDEGLIDLWDNRNVLPGADVSAAVDENLNAADVILLLMSSEFVTDEQCKKEIDAALAFADTGTKVVVPVLGRPVDWRRLARHNPLPSNSRPVTSWSSKDEAWENVRAGLRNCVERIGRGDRAPHRARGAPPLRRQTSRWTIGVSIAAAAVLLGLLGSARSYRSAITEGERGLNVGRAQEAEAAFTRALRLVPFGDDAHAGIEKARLWSGQPPDAVGWARAVNELRRRRPNDPQTDVLTARVAFTDGDYAEAARILESAVHRVPDLAEAYADLGSCYERLGRIDAAAGAYERAIEISRLTPRYVGNLAWVHAEEGRIDDAIREFQGIASAYPLGNIELAKLLWAKGEVQAAHDQQLEALDDLEKPEAGAAVENRGRWSFDAETSQGPAWISFDETVRHCYVRLELSVSLFFDGKRRQARDTIAGVFRACRANAHALVDIVDADLTWANRSPILQGRVGGYKALLAEMTGAGN